MRYGEELKYQREVRELTQSDLARATGLKQQMISHWEANKSAPSIDAIVTLADFYGIPIDELIGREKKQNFN